MFLSLRCCEPLVGVDKEFGLIPAVLWGMRKRRSVPLEPAYHRGAACATPLGPWGAAVVTKRDPQRTRSHPGHKAGTQEARLLFLPLRGFLVLQFHGAWVYYY